MFKVLLSPNRPVETGVSTKSEMPKATFKQVFDRNFGNRLVIGLHPGDVLEVPGRADVNHRLACFPEHLSDFVGLDPRDDPVTLPGPQPIRRLAPPLLFRQIDRPCLT